MQDAQSSEEPEVRVEDAFPWEGPFHRVDAPAVSPEDSDAPEHERAGTYNEAAVEVDGKVYLLYRAEDDWDQDKYISRIGLAESEDGIDFDRVASPVIDADGLYQEERGTYRYVGKDSEVENPDQYMELERRGVEDPRITGIDDSCYLTYTAFDGTDARLMLATASINDLEHWHKEGMITDGKAGAILDQPVNGKYVMYQGDKNMYLLHTEQENLEDPERGDPLDWKREIEPVLKNGRERGDDRDVFDYNIVEPGPPPMRVDEGILLLYNAWDDNGEYHVGAALFDADNPSRLIDKTDEPILSPEFEEFDRDVKHQHLESVVFAEGLVEKDGMYYLYFGAGDVYSCVATAPVKKE